MSFASSLSRGALLALSAILLCGANLQAQVTIIDNGDAGFTTSGTWTPFGGQGHAGDIHFASSGNGSSVATYTFSGLTPGVYRVSATWTARPDRVTDAAYTILDGSTVIRSVTRNQELAPDDLTPVGETTSWEDLGEPVNITGTTLVVRLSNLSLQGGQMVIADAVRINRNAAIPAGPEIEVYLNPTTPSGPVTNIADNTGSVNFGTTPVGTPVTRTFTVRNAGTAALTIVQPITVASGYTTNLAATSVAPGATTTFSVTLTATTIGTFTGQLSFANNDANENPYNFNLSGTVIQSTFPTAEIIDNRDPGYSELTAFWQDWPFGYNGLERYANPVGGADTQTAQWQKTGLPSGTYLVQATWAPDTATNVAYSIFDGTTLRQTVQVNQQLEPTGPTFGGRPFQTLSSSIQISSGTLRVTVVSNTTGYVMADAIRYSTSVAAAPEIDVLDGQTSIPDGSGNVSFGNTQLGTPVSKTFTVVNRGTATLNLTAPITVPAGFSVTNTFGNPTPAAGAVTMVPPGGSTSFTVQLNATASGNFSGQLSFANNDGNENPYNFNISGEVIAPGPEIQVLLGTTNIADNTGSVNFGTTGQGTPVLRTFTVRNLGTEDLTLTEPVSVASGFTVTATYGVPVLPPGRSTTFTVRLDAATLGTFSGRLSFPNNDSNENPFDFAISGTVVTAGPEIAVLDGTTDIPDNTGVVTYASTQVGLPITKTFTVRNTGTSDLTLTPPISVPAGFTVVTSFGATTLAPNAQTTFQVRLDAGSTGTFSGQLSFANNDSNENPFNFTVSGTVTPRVIANIIDDRDPGFSTLTNFWVNWPFGYNGNSRYANPVGGADTQIAQWQATELPAGSYIIQATWPFDTATNVVYSIYDGNTLLTTRTVNQQAEPVGPSFGGRPFQELGSFQISSGTLRVRIASNTSGYVIADAIRYETQLAAAPEIAVRDGTTDIPDNTGAVNFGSTAVGTPVSKTFTVLNQGSATLTLTPPITVPAGFTVTSSFGSTSLAPNASTTFTVRLDAATAGSFSGQLSFGNNDADENPYNFTINGTAVAQAPEIVVRDGTTDIPDNTGSVNYGTTTTGTAVSRTFTVQNIGTANLTLTEPISVPAGFTLTQSFGATTLAPNASTTFVVQLNAATAGTFSGQVSFGNNDADENPFNFNVSGVVNPPATPEITVLDGTTVIPDNTGSVTFATTTVGVPVSKTFTVRNDGTANLTLTPPISVPAGYTVTQTFGSTTLAPNASTTFVVRLDAASAGTFSGELSFGNNDGDENPFNFNISGTVNAVPEITVLDGTTVIPDNTGSVSFGTTTTGTAVSRTFTVRNDGTGNLNLQTPISAPAGYTVTQSFGLTQLAPGASTTFVVELTAATAGTFSGQLSFFNDDADENPFNFTVSGTVNNPAAPEITVLDGTTVIPDNTGSVNYGTTTTGTAVSRTFTVRNDGTANLILQTPITAPAGFTVTQSFGSTTLAPAATTTFVVRLDATAAGTFSGEVSFGNNDADENPFNFTVSGVVNAPAVPEITVLDGSTDISDNTGNVSFGTTTVGTTISKTFTVRNDGTANLTLQTPISVPAGYTVTQSFASTTLVPNATTTFVVRLDAATQGTFSGPVSFGNNDGDENPFNFNVTGTVNPVSSTVTIIDDNNPGFTAQPNGTPWIVGFMMAGQGFDNDITFMDAPATGDNTATWTFTGLTPGTYRVSATWTTGTPTRSTAAPYRIYDGPAGSANPFFTSVNQTIAPNGFQDAGVFWDDLAVVNVSGDTLAVQLYDETTGRIVADAIRIERLNNAQPTEADAIRFLEQASWGPNAATISRVRAIGFQAWINEQFALGQGSTYAQMPNVSTDQATGCPAGSPTTCVRDNYTAYLIQKQFYFNGMYGNDQLRQKVMFALSSTQVVGTPDADLQPIYRFIPYLNILDKSVSEPSFFAFNGIQFPRGNFRTLLFELTLNPAMGQYLDMANSTRLNPNENYAREILQLFSIGLFQLNQDGTLILSGGNPIDTYTQAEVVALTKVFTGWTFAPRTAEMPAGTTNYRDNMVLGGASPENPGNHDFTAKTFLGGSIPARTSSVANANQDLIDAINIIFNHPNVAPFMSKQLIQKLVTSNPTPAYVSRVAAVFNDNGLGIRGDIKSVVRAVLLDPEARGDHKDAMVSSSFAGYGKLREPIQHHLNILRAFNARSFDGTTTSDGVFTNIGDVQNMEQLVFGPPTVFAYYSPEAPLPVFDPIANPGAVGLLGPEFDIFNSRTAFARYNFMNTLIGPSAANTTLNVGIPVSANAPNGTSLDLNALAALSAADSTGGQLVDELNRLLLHGRMTSQMRTSIMNAVTNVTVGQNLRRARWALYLVATSSQYQVQQ